MYHRMLSLFVFSLVALAAILVNVADAQLDSVSSSTHPESQETRWLIDLSKARQLAKESDKPIMIVFR